MFIYLSIVRIVDTHIIPIPAAITRKTAKGIQIGAVTHHHDQSMYPVSLRPKNSKNNRLGKMLFDLLIFT